MSTRNIVPRADGEGSLGTADKQWQAVRAKQLWTDGSEIAIRRTAASHNALYRGDDLTNYFDSGEMTNDLSKGDFGNIFPGDFIVKSLTVNGITYENVKWIIGDLDYDIDKFNGDGVKITDHHVLVFPEKCIGTARMNATDTTNGGFLGSEMWTATLPKYAAGIKAAFGAAHVLTHKEFLTNAVNTSADSAAGSAWKGTATNVNWDGVDVVCNLFNEVQVYGATIFSGSGFDDLQDPRQVAAFRHNPSLYFDKDQWYWLRAFASASDFCDVDDFGVAGYNGASVVGGVRPNFLLR